MTTLLSALLVAAALRGSIEPSLRSEVRALGSSDAATTSADIELTPGLLARVGGRRVEVSLGYAPRLTLRGLGLEPALSALHTARFEASFRASRRLRLRLFGDGIIGTQSFTSVSLGEIEGALAPSIQALPSEATLPFLSLRTGAGAMYRPTRRITLDALVEYGVSGGLDASSREVIPLRIGPRAELGAGVALSRKDRARSSLEGAWTTFSDGPQSAIASLRETWTHRFTRRTESALAAGAGFGLTRGSSGEPWPLVVYPIAEASLLHRIPPRRVDIGLGVRLSPVLDWLTGELDSRVTGDASLLFQATRRVSIWGRAGAARSIPTGVDSSLTLFLGEAGVRARVSKSVELSSGTRGALQIRAETGSRQAQWTVFAGATITAPSVRF